MGLVGKSFSVDTKNVTKVLSQISAQRAKINKSVVKKMNAATTIVYATARAKRPMITRQQMKATGRRDRVSDPNATLGVPVRSGELQLSILKSVTDTGGAIIGKVFTKSPYGSYVEFGTSKMAARPFMRPALNIQMQAIRDIFNKKDNA